MSRSNFVDFGGCQTTAAAGSDAVVGNGSRSLVEGEMGGRFLQHFVVRLTPGHTAIERTKKRLETAREAQYLKHIRRFNNRLIVENVISNRRPLVLPTLVTSDLWSNLTRADPNSGTLNANEA